MEKNNPQFYIKKFADFRTNGIKWNYWMRNRLTSGGCCDKINLLGAPADSAGACHRFGEASVMEWNLGEAMEYYRRQGAPGDQNALIGLLKEIQQERGSIPAAVPAEIAAYYGIREALVLALIRRLPSLRLSGGHCMELCAGPNCAKSASLADYAEQIAPEGVTVRRTLCMRLCGKGPNLRWDGTVYHHADKALIRKLMQK